MSESDWAASWDPWGWWHDDGEAAQGEVGGDEAAQGWWRDEETGNAHRSEFKSCSMWDCMACLRVL